MKYVLDVTVTIYLFSYWDDQIGGTCSAYGKCVEDLSREASNNLLSGRHNHAFDGDIKMNLK
jgi:hypothetical protein